MDLNAINRLLKESPEDNLEPIISKYIGTHGIEAVMRNVLKAYSGSDEKKSGVEKILRTAISDIEWEKTN